MIREPRPGTTRGADAGTAIGNHDLETTGNQPGTTSGTARNHWPRCTGTTGSLSIGSQVPPPQPSA